MDYISVKLNKKNSLEIECGSGLNKTIPSVSPLQRCFENGLKGDGDSSPVNSDCDN